MKAFNIVLKTLALSIVCLLIVSCSKDEGVQSMGEARVNVLLGGVSVEESTYKMASASGETMRNVQQVSVPFNDDYTLVATLEATSSAPVSSKVNTTGGNIAATTTTKTVLEQGVQYRVVVYSATGQYLTNQVYTVGSTAATPIKLDAGKPYTFIAYSINSKTTVPDVDTQQNLTAATLANLNGSTDLMYFRSDVTLNGGDNNLNVVMKHLFSQITTSIDAAAIGVIESCIASIAPHHSAVSVKLENANISYLGSTGSVALAFTGLNTNKITSSSTIVNHPTTNAGVLTIASLKAGGITRTGLQVGSLGIVPGVKYNLNLTLTPNFGISLGKYTWAPANLVYNNGTYGFAANQGVYGDLWEANALLPINKGTGSAGQPNYDPAKDPCKQVQTHGGNWRTPTMQEMQDITGVRGEKPVYLVDYSTNPPKRANYNGVGGAYLGINKQPDAGKEDNYIFLPYAGEWKHYEGAVKDQGSFGTYWTSTLNSGERVERFQFNTGNFSWWDGQAQYIRYGGSIRCIKSY